MARSRIIAGKAVIIIEAQELVNKTLGKVRANLHKFANEVGNIGETAFRTGFFGSIASGAIIGSFVKFDDAMRTLRVNLDLFGKSAQQVDRVMKPLEGRIRSLAQSTPFSPTEVAVAATELAKGGFSPKQIEESLQAVLDLARATNTELGFSAEFVVRTLTTYGIATEDAAEVVSQLVRASRKGTLGIEDLEAAMRYSSGTADTLGVSLQKMLAIFTVLSNRGLVGSIAGTSTNTAFSQLVKKAQQLKDIGKIDLITGIRQDGREALDVIKSLEGLFRYAETLPFTEQQTLFQDIFNLRGARSVSAIRREIDTIKSLSGFIADANDEAREAARIQDAGIGGSLRRLLSTIQDLNIALGQSTEKIIIGIASAVKGLLEELNKLAATNPVLTSLVVLSPGILLGAGVGLLALSKALRVAAYGAGALKAALLPLGRFLTKGTAGQIALLSQIRNRTPTPRTPAVPRTPLSLVPPVNGGTQAQRLLVAQNQRAAALAVQRRAQAENLLAKAERNRAAARTKLTTSQNSITKGLVAQRAVLDQNTRSIQANIAARKANNKAVRLTAAFQQSINRLQAEDFAIQQKLNKTRISRDPRGGLREIPNLATAELKKLTADRERIAFQIFKLKQEQTKLAAVDPIKLELRQKSLLAERATTLKKVTDLEKTAASLARGKTSVESRYVKQLAKGQDLLIDSAKAQQSIQKVSGGARQALTASLNRTLTNTGRVAANLGTRGASGLLSFGKGLLTFANATRRFVFSASGVLTILEGLLLFGDKIPGISTILERFGQGFANAFRAVGNIAKFAAGPIALLKASIEAFTAGRSDLGIQGLSTAFSSLVSIIGNQLVAAWNRFKAAIAPVYDTIVALFTTISVTVTSIVNSISEAVGATFSTQKALLGSLTGDLFGSSGGLASAASSIGEAIARFVPQLFNWLAQLSVVFNEAAQKFVVSIERTFSMLNPFNDQDKADKLYQAQLADIKNDAKARRKLLAIDLKETQDAISRSFTQSSLQTSRRNATRAVNNSAARAQEALTMAQAIRQEIAKIIPQAAASNATFPQSITPQGNPLSTPGVRAMVQMVEALVGSAQSTNRNLLKAGKPIEQKQLEEQQKTNEILKTMAKDQGLRFAP